MPNSELETVEWEQHKSHKLFPVFLGLQDSVVTLDGVALARQYSESNIIQYSTTSEYSSGEIMCRTAAVTSLAVNIEMEIAD